MERGLPEDRFWKHVLVIGQCYIWQGSTNGKGYGKFWYGKDHGGLGYAHRWSYENNVGPIPSDLELDHSCHNTLCVNWNHLEPVTHQRNIRRAWQKSPR